ncbi:4-hydroxy-3-methylbut-2-enyl diphosphate reductase [Afifella marina]|uniref:4-hydroxy-3-methylbut-2-enyl diphosphate reductase n=1 Tax=Afifella marina DSM 2698 TaxID=1120955 RepID=A0A1G5P0W1_AFIMA|nr:4-hydroxy-3-methylbut-2-enyl diphosphate reductase [Afifella marina]MBK1624310.1 4-hydroxy-3-methylbut-2-enyl diphosphate reductase [Afifella marina DSM 2698]MBK1628043.1 4-hydroxy-3-methylbut-2-enyl diphosphate reductase [Afifella marina]MBK5918237.1 4-hydroxy-3-methylbut-2-enyl diphosphate reductase [Afifella marina]RAI19273.1 4-hydroxy-3-methylbut-2-enyl diphosphate reductase [Afifella marina DSM 2698]SCZ43197.1 4-hydroxy-3-methylbut-2-enyl diphosphate reductase [Afifella marina DSM 2698
MATGRSLRVILAQPRGFCAGVERAITIVERALSLYGPPVYVRHQIVHNQHVVDTLKERGAVFVEETDEIPDGSVTVFSAHGVSRAVADRAAAKKLDVVDATCPLVQRVQREGRRYAKQGYDVVLIGHAGHAEVEGTRGQIDGRLHILSTPDAVAEIDVADPERVAYITQTTLSLLDTRNVIAALKARFPSIVGPETRNICYATQNRQTAVLDLAAEIEMLVVVGSANSSNSSRLRELGEASGIPSYLIEAPHELDPAWLRHVDRLGVTAGASAPEASVQAVLNWLRTFRTLHVETLDGIEEKVHFKLPQRLLREALADA